MFKYRFACANKSDILYRIDQMVIKDLPCGKSLFGGDLFKAGIHFEKSGEQIKGFFLAESENGSLRGSPIRVCFSGAFVEENNGLFFDVYIYPRIIEIVFLTVTALSLTLLGDVVSSIIAVAVFGVFCKGYMDMMKNTYRELNRIFVS